MPVVRGSGYNLTGATPAVSSWGANIFPASPGSNTWHMYVTNYLPAPHPPPLLWQPRQRLESVASYLCYPNYAEVRYIDDAITFL